jgi:hypothetical protein
MRSSEGDDKDKAMSVSSNGKGKHFKCKPHGICWNCGEKGHFKDKCPKPAKSNKKKNDSSKKVGSVNATIDSGSEGNGAFFAELCDLDSDIPELKSVSDSGSDLELQGESDGDWFSEIDDLDSDEDTKVVFGPERSECGSHMDPNLVVIDLDEAAAHVEPSSKAKSSPHVEVYDSRCTRHIAMMSSTSSRFP